MAVYAFPDPSGRLAAARNSASVILGFGGESLYRKRPLGTSFEYTEELRSPEGSLASTKGHTL
jgi:hypothetical protein